MLPACLPPKHPCSVVCLGRDTRTVIVPHTDCHAGHSLDHALQGRPGQVPVGWVLLRQAVLSGQGWGSRKRSRARVARAICRARASFLHVMRPSTSSARCIPRLNVVEIHRSAVRVPTMCQCLNPALQLQPKTSEAAALAQREACCRDRCWDERVDLRRA